MENQKNGPTPQSFWQRIKRSFSKGDAKRDQESEKLLESNHKSTNEFYDVTLFWTEIEKDTTGSPSNMFRGGVSCGEKLVDSGDIETFITAIGKKYDAMASYLENAQLNISSHESKKIEILNEKYQKLLSDLDEADENSKISKIKTEINIKKREMEGFINEIYGSSLHDLRKLADESKKEHLKNWTATITEQIVLIRGEFSNEIQHLAAIIKAEIKNIISGADASIHGNKEVSIAHRSYFKGVLDAIIGRGTRGTTDPVSNNMSRKLERMRELNKLIKRLPLVSASLSKALSKLVDKFDNLYKAITKKFETAEYEVINGKSNLWPKSQILLFYTFAIMLFFGESYLVYAFTTETLGFAIKYDKALLSNFILIAFCFAFPLSLGMFYKERISNSKAKEKRFFDFSWGSLIPIMVVAISIPNAITLVNKLIENKSLENLGTSNLALYIIMGFFISLFLTILSLSLARTGAWVFSEAQIAHRTYISLTRQGLLSGFSLTKLLRWIDPRKSASTPPSEDAFLSGKWQFQARTEIEIGRLEREIEDLKNLAKDTFEELNRAKALGEAADAQTGIKQVVQLFKETAVLQFMAGYIEGKSAAEDSKDEEQLLRKKIKQSITL